MYFESSATDLDDIGSENDQYNSLTEQRVFGAGLKRKRISFVPASQDDTTTKGTNTSTISNASSTYLSIVLQGRRDSKKETADETEPETDGNDRCSLCGQPLVQVGDGSNPSHNTSIAHQLCLQHSYPPSHLDRSRLGVKYLEEYGWDPDARLGLGSRQEGIRIPVKAKPKHDNTGLGLFTRDDDDKIVLDRREKKKKKPDEPETNKLNAKQVRKMEEIKGKQTEKLRVTVYGEDWSSYLGAD